MIYLDELDMLEKEATPAPWNFYITVGHLAELVTAPEVSNIVEFKRAYKNRINDVEFIVTIRNVAPELIAELRDARKRIAELEPLAVLGAVHTAPPGTQTYESKVTYSGDPDQSDYEFKGDETHSQTAMEDEAWKDRFVTKMNEQVWKEEGRMDSNGAIGGGG